MKTKSILMGLFVACTALFAACDDMDINDLLKDAIGHAEYGVSNIQPNILSQTDPLHQAGDTIEFHSVLADACNGNVWLNGDSVPLTGFVAVGANSTISSSAFNVSFPFFGIKLQSENPGTFQIASPFSDSEFLSTLQSDWKQLLTDDEQNIFLMAEADPNGDTLVCIGVGGTVTIDNMPEYGSDITGRLTNVEVRVVRFDNLDAVNELVRLYMTDPTNPAVQALAETAQALLQNGNYEPFFPKMTLNGNFVCARANVVKFVENMQH